MSRPPADSPRKPVLAMPLRLAVRRLAGLALDALAFSLAAVAVTGFVISLGRREIARDLILLYFQEHGIEAQVEIDDVNVAGLSGSLRLGPANHPDLDIEKFEITFASKRAARPRPDDRCGPFGSATDWAELAKWAAGFCQS